MADSSNEKWRKYVQGFVDAYAFGSELTPTGRAKEIPDSLSAINLPFQCHENPVLLLCSPHPDDEILNGVLPLRIKIENGARVINVAITLGSAQEHKKRRLKELEKACDVVGFELQVPCGSKGFEGLAPDMEKNDPDVWQRNVAELVELFAHENPEIVFAPHACDGHPTHIASHNLTEQALKNYTMSCGRTVALFETEFWQPMEQPNMLVGVNVDDLALLIRALSCHQGEIARNPYHLRQPARLMDNVRRGSEIMGNSRQGQDFLFGELYRMSLWQNGKQEWIDEGFCIAPDSAIGICW